MIEMELRAILENKLNVMKKLEKFGCKWVIEDKQVDVIYLQRDTQAIINIPVFRIRKINNNIILTLKIMDDDYDTAEELELEVSDEKTMSNMLNIIGYHPEIEVAKNRRQTQYRGYNICIDEIEHLGEFIEIECISENRDDKDKIYEEMKSVLMDLGVKENNIIKEKYFEMLLKEKKHE
jgi:adenylate cyclase class 2